MRPDGGKPVSNPKAGTRGHALSLNDKQVGRTAVLSCSALRSRSAWLRPCINVLVSMPCSIHASKLELKLFGMLVAVSRSGCWLAVSAHGHSPGTSYSLSGAPKFYPGMPMVACLMGEHGAAGCRLSFSRISE